MRRFLSYVFTDGKTPLSGHELTRRFTDIDGRLHALEELTVSWEEAVAEVQNHGLVRINTVIQPVLDQARALIEQVEQDITGIEAQWQAIVDAWAGMQAVVDGLGADVDAVETGLAQAVVDLQAYAAAQDALRPVVPEWWGNPDDSPPENVWLAGWPAVRMAAGGESLIRAEARLSHEHDHQVEITGRMSTAAADDVVLSLAYGGLADGEDPASWTAAATIAETVTMAASTGRFTATLATNILGSNLASGDSTLLEFMRDGDAAADTHGGDLDVISVRLLPAAAG